MAQSTAYRTITGRDMLTYLHALTGPNLERLICLGMLCLLFDCFCPQPNSVAKPFHPDLLSRCDYVCHQATLAQ